MTYQILELEEHMLVPHDWCILVAGYVSHVFRVLFDTIDVDFENEINRPKQKQAITFKSFCWVRLSLKELGLGLTSRLRR